MKHWIAVPLLFVVMKDLGNKCIDTIDKGHNEVTVCAPVWRFSLKGFPDCESQYKEDCSYMYEVAARKNEQIEKENIER